MIVLATKADLILLMKEAMPKNMELLHVECGGRVFFNRNDVDVPESNFWCNGSKEFSWIRCGMDRSLKQLVTSADINELVNSVQVRFEETETEVYRIEEVDDRKARLCYTRTVPLTPEELTKYHFKLLQNLRAGALKSKWG